MYIELDSIFIFISLLLIALTTIFIIQYGNNYKLTHRMLQLFNSSIEWKKAQYIYIKTLRKALEQLNVTVEEHYDADSNKLDGFEFQYQNGLFTIYLPQPQNNKCIQLNFPYIDEAPLDNISNVRTICNELNNVTHYVRTIYTFDDKDNKLNFHVTCCIPPTMLKHELVDTLQLAMSECFAVRNLIHDRLKTYNSESNELHVSDLQSSYFNTYEQINWVNQIEAKHDMAAANNEDTYTLSVDHCKLGHWLNHMHILPTGCILQHLVSEGDDGYHFMTQNDDAINNYSMIEPIVHQVNLPEAPKAQLGCIHLTYQHQGEEQRSHLLSITLENAGVMDGTVFIRFSYMLPEKSTSTKVPFRQDNGYSQLSGDSFMIGFDWKDGKSKQTEFDYMWKDAQDKAKEGKTDEWTPEQRMIYLLTNAELGYDLYWGKKLYRQKRFYEATLHLGRAFNMLNNDYEKLNNNSKDTFYEICFLLGNSYMELHQYQMAHYYLKDYKNFNRSYYLKAYINCLIALNDNKCGEIISNNITALQMHLQEIMDKDKEVPENLLDLYNFLRRRDIYFCIQKHYLNDAENNCKSMLDEEDNKDFAINELNYIQQLRESGVENCERPTYDDDLPF